MLNTKRLKKYRKNDVCAWCQYELAFNGPDGRFHASCPAKPDYHDVEKYWAWQKEAKDFRGNGKRRLSPEEARNYHNFAEWKTMKEGDIMYD